MFDEILSVVMVASLLFLVYEMYKFKNMHQKKYEVPTDAIWEKFVGLKPEDMEDSNLTLKVQKLEGAVKELGEKAEKQEKLTKKLIKELGE